MSQNNNVCVCVCVFRVRASRFSCTMSRVSVVMSCVPVVLTFENVISPLTLTHSSRTMSCVPVVLSCVPVVLTVTSVVSPPTLTHSSPPCPVSQLSRGTQVSHRGWGPGPPARPRHPAVYTAQQRLHQRPPRHPQWTEGLRNGVRIVLICASWSLQVKLITKNAHG